MPNTTLQAKHDDDGFVSVGGFISRFNDPWVEYDHAAADLARKGLTGAIGDALPNLMSADAVDLINADPEAFMTRVRAFAYAQSMDRLNLPEDMD